jgi:hypothetical protein
MNYSFIDNFTPKDFVTPEQNILYNQNNTFNKSGENTNKQKSLDGYHFPGYVQDKDNWATEGSISKSILGNLMAPTPVSELFLSRQNINRIQKMIKLKIFEETNGKYLLNINQNESDIIIVMRNVILTDAVNSPYKVVHQVKILNNIVLKRVIPDMITAIKQDDAYIQQLDKPIDPIPLPVNVNSKGRRQLPSVTTTF